MKHGTRWIALSMLVMAYGRSASPQVRTSVRALTITALRPSMAVTAAAPSTRACADPGSQTCGLGVCAVTVARCQNNRAVTCAPDVNRRVPETCDGLDNDCDGVVDNAPSSRVVRSACPAAAACEAVRAVALTPGVTDWRLAPASGRTCAPPFAAGASTHELHVVTVATRTAVALSTAQGGLALFAADRSAPALVTVDGLCAPGTRTGAAILEAGTYVLRATGDGAGARSVHVEAVAVPARAAAPVNASSSRVTLSTATLDEAPFDCRASEGVDVRVLVCPRGASAVLSSPRGFLASVEGAAGGRTCYPVSSQRAQAVPLPAGALAVVRAWPSGAERGPAFVDFR